MFFNGGCTLNFIRKFIVALCCVATVLGQPLASFALAPKSSFSDEHFKPRVGTAAGEPINDFLDHVIVAYGKKEWRRALIFRHTLIFLRTSVTE